MATDLQSLGTVSCGKKKNIIEYAGGEVTDTASGFQDWENMVLLFPISNLQLLLADKRTSRAITDVLNTAFWKHVRQIKAPTGLIYLRE